MLFGNCKQKHRMSFACRVKNERSLEKKTLLLLFSNNTPLLTGVVVTDSYLEHRKT